MKEFMLYIPTRLIFGAGSIKKLHEQRMPGKKALLIISNGKSAKTSGALDKTIHELGLANIPYAIFNGIEANPLKESVMSGAKAARDNGCDFIVALGGGSVLDASKAIAAMATNDGDIWDYISGGTGKGQPLACAPLSIIAITTTAGTGSEVDQWGVISNMTTNEKIGFGGDDRLFPVIAIVDAELMLSVPPIFTAYQGFDALFHSTEVHFGKRASGVSDIFTTAAIKAIGANLAKAVNDGNDIEARSQVAFANTMSGYAMEAGCTTAQHSIEHAMSAYHHALPHGAGLIMISKAFSQFFIDKHACDDKFVEMARLLGDESATKPQDFITALDNLQKACGVDNLKMSDYGITPSEFDAIAINARETMGGLFAANPCEMTQADVVTVLKNSYR